MAEHQADGQSTPNIDVPLEKSFSAGEYRAVKGLGSLSSPAKTPDLTPDLAPDLSPRAQQSKRFVPRPSGIKSAVPRAKIVPNQEKTPAEVAPTQEEALSDQDLEILPAEALGPMEKRAPGEAGEGKAPRKSIMLQAVRAIEALDPLSESGIVEDPFSGRHLPGRVPLAPISFSSFLLVCLALIHLLLFSMDHLLTYAIPFSVAYVIQIGHLWAYHLAYHTRRRFSAALQIFFLIGLVFFMSWTLLDLMARPELQQEDAQRGLMIAFGADVIAAALMFSHWSFFGRGSRPVA